MSGRTFGYLLGFPFALIKKVVPEIQGVIAIEYIADNVTKVMRGDRKIELTDAREKRLEVKTFGLLVKRWGEFIQARPEFFEKILGISLEYEDPIEDLCRVNLGKVHHEVFTQPADIVAKKINILIKSQLSFEPEFKAVELLDFELDTLEKAFGIWDGESFKGSDAKKVEQFKNVCEISESNSGSLKSEEALKLLRPGVALNAEQVAAKLDIRPRRAQMVLND
jgi:hypothetical protein